MEWVSFRRMDEGKPTNYTFLSRLEDEFVTALPERILDALNNLDNSLAGYQISRLQRSVQSATRAELDGADVKMIVRALIHDLCDDLAPLNHSQFAAAIIRPYVRSKVAGIIEHHGIFQLYYYGDTTGVDKNAREIYRGHKYLIVEKNFVSLGIKCHLIPIMLAITLHILHRWFVKFFHGHHLTPALS